MAPLSNKLTEYIGPLTGRLVTLEANGHIDITTFKHLAKIQFSVEIKKIIHIHRGSKPITWGTVCHGK